MAFLFSFLLTRTGRMVAGAGGVLLLIWAFGAQQRSIGARKAVAQIEKKTDADINRAKSAGAKSAAGGGVLIPFRD